MNAQFKKGVLELIVLAAVEQKDMYGYELVAEVSKVVNVKEGRELEKEWEEFSRNVNKFLKER